MRVSAIAVSATIGMGFFSASCLLAQSSPATQSAICMAATTSGARGGEHSFIIIVPHSAKDELNQRGFQETSCGNRSFDLQNYRAKICSFAENSPQVALSRFEQVRNVSAAELCTFAKMVESSQ